MGLRWIYVMCWLGMLFKTICMPLHDRMKKSEFRYAVVDSGICKIWALANDWEAFPIYNPDDRNAKQVRNTMRLWRETQNKKMIRYLNKQNFCVSYIDIRRQSKK